MQRSDEDPSVFEITYRGRHTCSHANNLVPVPPSPEKQEEKQNNHTHDNQQEQPLDILANIRSSLRIQTEDFDNTEMGAYPFSFPSTSFGCMNSANSSFSLSALEHNTPLGSSKPFLSPATPESNYFSGCPFQKTNSGGLHNVHRSESDLTEMISANTSATCSPTLDLDFSLDPVEIDPNFPFDSLAFFS